MTAEQLVKFGMVSEIVQEKLMDRAYEIADILMAQNRIARRLATQVIRRPWKQRIVDDLDCSFGTEMFGMFCANELHSDLLSMVDYLGMTGKIDPPFVGKVR